MSSRATRRRAALPAVLLVAGLTACAPALPETVVPGSVITAAWTGEFTSANAVASPTPGNVAIAAATRSGFGDLVDGEFVPDEGFGVVSIVSDDPFTVRYDLAEPAWSDGIPLDAADLVMGWVAASGHLGPAAAPDAAATSVVASIDEFARAIEVTFPQPISDWQEFIAVPVPAHVVARRALGVDDAMEAKQAVLTAARGDDAEAFASMAEVWNEGFAVSETGEFPTDLSLSSGPFRVGVVDADAEGQSVTLVPNAAYRGGVTPTVARIELVPAGADPAAAIGDRLDIAQVAPVAANRAPIQALERRDITLNTTHDGTVWALQLNTSGALAQQSARAAFLRAISGNALIERGGGQWASAYTATTSMLSAPGSRAYDIVNQDSGFAAALTGGDDPAAERAAAGIAPGTPVCVLYDRGGEFAVGAFAAVRDAAQEAGWSAVDCGTDDLEGTIAQGGWDAVITRVPIAWTAAQISAQWGGTDPERDALIAEFARTTDVYTARDLRARIEATIIRAAVALPIAVNPSLTLVDTDVTGIAMRNAAPLTSDAVQWAVVQ